ncbi:hypothetical protein F9U64_01065 [Gracilibacillus oryzae]|uniref:Uncharacterized protein n=1 Tax=Gracilibacillus oryzae TaxID=1672701 RepID=A0A7C8L9T0_9BACI|nr:hypothetical protein [Gracilibacillus oryzae]KAB8139244.1 hypothetical protein F9U64_01065 [Gracilibacillus oryzae]
MDSFINRSDRYKIETKYDKKTELIIIRVHDHLHDKTYVYHEDEIFNLPADLFDMQCYIYSVWDQITTGHFSIRNFDPGYNYCRITMLYPSDKNKYV